MACRSGTMSSGLRSGPSVARHDHHRVRRRTLRCDGRPPQHDHGRAHRVAAIIAVPNGCYRLVLGRTCPIRDSRMRPAVGPRAAIIVIVLWHRSTSRSAKQLDLNWRGYGLLAGKVPAERFFVGDNLESTNGGRSQADQRPRRQLAEGPQGTQKDVADLVPGSGPVWNEGSNNADVDPRLSAGNPWIAFEPGALRRPAWMTGPPLARSLSHAGRRRGEPGHQ